MFLSLIFWPPTNYQIAIFAPRHFSIITPGLGAFLLRRRRLFPIVVYVMMQVVGEKGFICIHLSAVEAIKIKMRKGNPLRDVRWPWHRPVEPVGWEKVKKAKKKKKNRKRKEKPEEEKEHISLSHLGSRSRARSFSSS